MPRLNLSLSRKVAAVFVLVGMLLVVNVQAASAHFTMLLPGDDLDVTADDYIVALGDEVSMRILWGHPFEHILFDCPGVPEVTVMAPDGELSTPALSETALDGYTIYEVSFTVNKIGDHIVYAKLAADDHGLVDYVKAVIHCGEEAWTGWDATTGQDVELIPYTRPYGLEPGFVFTGKAIADDGAAISGATTEIEKYNIKSDGDALVTEAEERFPEDPPMMFTRVTTTNASGEFCYTLDEPGIWFIGVTTEVEDGLEKRAVMIVPVSTPFPQDTAPAEAADDDTSSNAWAYVAFGIAVVALLMGVTAVVRRRS